MRGLASKLMIKSKYVNDPNYHLVRKWDQAFYALIAFFKILVVCKKISNNLNLIRSLQSKFA